MSSSSNDYCAHLLDDHSSLTINSGSLTGAEIMVLCTYLGTILLLVAGPSHLPCFRRQGWWTEKTVYAPLSGLVFLTLASFCLPPKHKSLVSLEVVKETAMAKIPIILLILSFAYLSISLDLSRFFKEAAYYVVRMAKGDGRRLLIYVYLLCNDIVIISMTPLIMHIGDCSSISNLVPLLITIFIAANTSSMGLLVGSPTNIILGDAMHVSFAQYWVMMLLPTVVAVAGTLVMLMVVFVWCPLRGNVMVARFEMKNGAAAVNGVVVAAAAADSFGGIEEEETIQDLEREEGIVLATTVAASPSQGEHEQQEDDNDYSNKNDRHNDSDNIEKAQQHENILQPPQLLAEPDNQKNATLMTSAKTRYVKVFVFFLVLILLSLSSYILVELWAVSAISALVMLGMDLLICHKDGKSKLSFFFQVYQRMPWSIAPFVLCMFILVRVLTEVGFTLSFAKAMTGIAGKSVWSQPLVFGYVSAIMVNILNDLPSSVLWSDMLPFLCQHYSRRSFHVIVQSLLVGVNPGTYLTIIGALAGLIWKQIITSQPGSSKLRVARASDLTFYGVLVLLPVMLVTCLAISAQSYLLIKE